MFEETPLWKKTLSHNSTKNLDKVEELRQAFLKFRDNASFLVSRISADLPGLTQHDITHLDNLWDTASIIAGENYPINPLEGFILGGAILLHDSALCFEAYEDGKNGLRNTSQWKDAYAELIEKAESIGEDELTTKEKADFAALRELHAIQAEDLLQKAWIDPDNNQEIYLLENFSLRKHLGKLIGKIAASHHWEIEDLELKLSSQQNVLPGFPREWRIDPVKIACLLRCADAAHIDNNRAPDFLHALLNRSGISFQHWTAQNKIAKVDIDQSNGNDDTLLYTSTTEFQEKDANAWYVIFDAVNLINKEIQACNSLLTKKNPEIAFKIKKVSGVESPEKLSQFVRVENWKPCSAQVHVGNIEKLIENLGGEMLYGKGNDPLGIAIRELIQNSRDSIKARNYYDDRFSGIINLRLLKSDQGFDFVVEDNGIGMSERVLIGPLLDFGTSFWTSSLVKSEFPGLRSSNFRSVGKFGIGFYSVFMVAEETVVSSKNWNDGLSDVHQMKFNSGFSLRPIIRKGPVEDFHTSISTRVKLRLKQNIIPDDGQIKIKSSKSNSEEFIVPFEEYLSAICVGLDTDVYYSQKENDLGKKIHENIKSSLFNKKRWLKKNSFTDYQSTKENESYITNNISRLRYIKEDDEILGLAAINTLITNDNNYFSIKTVGGLAHPVHSRSGNYYFGFIDYSPKSAKRDLNQYSAKEETIKNWANEQFELLKKLRLNPLERYCASAALCHFKIDPSDFANILVSIDKQRTFLTINQLAAIALTKEIAFIQVSYSDGNHIEMHHKITDLEGYILILPITGGEFLSLKRNEQNIPENNFSILDCIYRKIKSQGFEPEISQIKNVGKNNFNQDIDALTIKAVNN